MRETFVSSHSLTVVLLLSSQLILWLNLLQLSTTFSILSKHSTQDAKKGNKKSKMGLQIGSVYPQDNPVSFY